ncbi:TetR family transcriptional regulator C-terminal domain-containing protein [Streptomyces monticola]|uniref:TetR family transcriptional regulator C-terminal domain-containing protein n=1 Tax=Streptomyces monticola TaxID=2666263 RepID=A0ABW2JHG7_9ACTN
MLSVLERSEQHDVERLFADELDCARELFTRLLDLAGVNSRRPGLVRMFNVLVGESGNPGHPAHSYFKVRYERALATTAEILQRAVRSGELKAGTDCEASAGELLAVMDGLQIQWILDPDGIDMVDRFRRYLDRTLRTLTVDGSGLPDDA